MSTLVKEETNQVQAIGVRFRESMLILELSDGREIGLPMDKIHWLDWLYRATPEQRARWDILPHGYGIYWQDLDDGFEVTHALSLEPLT